MDYGGILKRAWEITWKNKGLWLLGLLAGCSSGSGNPTASFNWQLSRSDFPGFRPDTAGISEELWIPIILGLVLFGLLIFAVFVVLGLLGQAGLIAGVARADEKGSVRLSEAWSAGLPHFWRMLGLAALLLLLAVLVAVAFLAFGLVTLGIGYLCLLPLICLLIPIGILITGYISLTQNGIVLEGLGVFQALQRSWQLVMGNFWPVVAMALILTLVEFVVAILLMAPFFLAILPVIAIAAAASDSWTAFVPFAACLVGYIPVMIVLGAILTTWTNGVWTLTYRRLIGVGPMAASVPAPA